MQVKSRVENQIKILELSGRFDISTADTVREWIDDVTTTKPAMVVVNMEHVHFVDSTGLSTLVHGMKRSQSLEGDLHICGLQQSVRIIFELTRLDGYFNIFGNESEAVSAFAN